MASLIQVKRSTSNAVPAALAAGELAYSFLNTSNSLFVGNTTTGGPIRIGGGNYNYLHQANTSQPGTLTANAAVIVNGNSFVTNWKTNSLTVGIDGETVAISNISTSANSTYLGSSSSGSNTELVTSYAIKTYVDAKSAAASIVATNNQILYGNNNTYGQTSGFTFDYTSNTLAIGNSSVNTTINSSSISTGSAFVSNVSSSGDLYFLAGAGAHGFQFKGSSGIIELPATGQIVGAPYGASQLELSAGVASLRQLRDGNITLQVGTGGSATKTLTFANTGDLTAPGNITANGVANVISLNSTGTATSTFANNVTITGTANVLSLNVGGDATISGNLYITGNLVSFNVSSLSVSDSLLFLAANNISTDIFDIGFAATYGPDGNTANHRHTGFFRDATDGVYKLFTGLLPEPTTTVDTSNATYAVATLQAHLSSGGASATGFIANATTIAITANSTLNVAFVANTLTLSSALEGTSGGTGLSSFTSEDLLVANSTNGFRKLNVGSDGYILQVASGVVAWNTLDGGSF